VVFILSMLVACSKGPMQQPLEFKNTAEFFRQLEQLQKELPKDDYIQLTDAIGYLKIHSTDIPSIDEFYNSLNQLSPNEIIKKQQHFKSSKQKK